MPRQQPVERVRLRWPDAARGLAILLVVVLHATRALGDLDLTGAWGTVLAGWDRVNAALGTMRMPLFFAVAGLFAGKWVRGPWRALLASKVALFAWLLLLWPFVRALGYLLGPSSRATRPGARGARRARAPARPGRRRRPRAPGRRGGALGVGVAVGDPLVPLGARGVLRRREAPLAAVAARAAGRRGGRVARGVRVRARAAEQRVGQRAQVLRLLPGGLLLRDRVLGWPSA